ncbi:MAG: hypothetical protein HQL95_02420 [Magnetococcales bacterium]|nr:hypothetical protein [Magnetococcales bacterium]
MHTLEGLLQASGRWVTETWQRLAQPDPDGAVGSGDGVIRPGESRWSLTALRVTLSQTGRKLAEWWQRSGRLPPEPSGEPALTYRRNGQLQAAVMPESSTAWTRPPDRLGHWSTPAYRVRLSPPGRVAGGAMASLHAAPGELDRFVEGIRNERRAGFYPAEVFQQARELLRQTGEEESSRVSAV